MLSGSLVGQFWFEIKKPLFFNKIPDLHVSALRSQMQTQSGILFLHRWACRREDCQSLRQLKIQVPMKFKKNQVIHYDYVESFCRLPDHRG